MLSSSIGRKRVNLLCLVSQLQGSGLLTVKMKLRELRNVVQMRGELDCNDIVAVTFLDWDAAAI